MRLTILLVQVVVVAVMVSGCAPSRMTTLNGQAEIVNLKNGEALVRDRAGRCYRLLLQPFYEGPPGVVLWHAICPLKVN